ncbi:XkdX family protein [Sporosarcina sp. P33]|uniref:XkdX family protein n=1 Tax=Sporosarcina sp. P33 TaxID=1930764 RepID=UPI0009BCF6A1|nr:XkdX family protein [Sporosarcina sp. P33]ARD47558.1 hypothetical protein SporoP33_04445 [Sporosarcina sp. P33]
MTYWELAYGWGWATADQLRLATKLGELAKEDFERITGELFDPVKEEPVPEPEKEPVVEEEVVEEPPVASEEPAPKK